MSDPRINPALLAPPLAAQAPARAAETAPAGAFDGRLREAISSVRFSAHAGERLGQRGLQLSDDQLGRLAGGVDAAAAKGSRSALVLVDDVAMIVAVPARTVVTAVDAQASAGVFTNIDSAVVA